MPESKSPTAPLIPARRYLASLRGTHDEVYTKVILAHAKSMALTADGWARLLDGIKAKPAHRPGR